MNIIIQSPGFTASEALKSFIHQKLNSIKYDRIIQATVTLYKGPVAEPDGNYCEIRLATPGRDNFVKRHFGRFETAINKCVEVLKKQLQQQKVKYLHTRQGSAVTIQDAINQAETDRDPELEDIVKNKKA